MPQGCQNSCVIRSTIYLHFFSEPWVKGTIVSQTDSTTKKTKEAWKEWIKKNGHTFKENKRPTKLKHKLEPANIQNQGKQDSDEEQAQEEPSWLDTLGLIELKDTFKKKYKKEIDQIYQFRQQIAIGLVMLVVMMLILRVGSLQNSVDQLLAQ